MILPAASFGDIDGNIWQERFFSFTLAAQCLLWPGQQQMETIDDVLSRCAVRSDQSLLIAWGICFLTLSLFLHKGWKMDVFLG